MTTYTDYMNAKARRDELAATMTFEQFMNHEIPEGIAECDEIISKFEHSHPYRLYVSNGNGTYSIKKIYATAEEAIADCPEYDAHVENYLTDERVFTAKYHD